MCQPVQGSGHRSVQNTAPAHQHGSPLPVPPHSIHTSHLPGRPLVLPGVSAPSRVLPPDRGQWGRRGSEPHVCVSDLPVTPALIQSDSSECLRPARVQLPSIF